MTRRVARRLALSLVILLPVIYTSCQHNPVGAEAQPQVCFETEVLPIFQTNCAKSGCHNGGEGMDLGSAAGIIANVTPHDPQNSRLYNAITSTWGNIMPPPPNRPLDRLQRTTIALWILQGAKTTCQN